MKEQEITIIRRKHPMIDVLLSSENPILTTGIHTKQVRLYKISESEIPLTALNSEEWEIPEGYYAIEV